ncbi:MAG: sulfatase-like hydrolase/transferase, partial [Actinomycetia bacterium]|nr:sulfatase-like hydrolase/transferase [Actinomycetes bacterium]
MRTRVAVPVGAACVAVAAAALPSIASSGAGNVAARGSVDDARPVAFTPAGVSRIRHVSVENVADFVAVRVRHRGSYWDGQTNIAIGVDGKRFPYRAHVSKGDEKLELNHATGSNWKCSGARADAPDASDETLLVIPRSCFDGSTQTVQARVTANNDDGGSSSATSDAVQHTERPNVVVIMSDDMREDELDGPWMAQTRRQIGDRGVRFQNSLAPLPLCAPARASFLTGQYPHNHGVWSHRAPYGFPVFKDDETLPVWLQRGGYHTFMLGKYINGYAKKGMPAPDGGSAMHYVPPGWSDWRASMDGRGTYNYRGTHLNNNGHVQSLRGTYQTNAYRRISVNKVRERARADKPYFMYLSFTAPHHGKPKENDDPVDVSDINGEEYKIKTPARRKETRGRWDDAIRRAPGVGSDEDMSDKPEFMQRLPELTQSERDGVRALAR